MDAKSEQRSLALNPLPAEAITPEEGDNLLPSRILDMDHKIANLEQALEMAREAKKQLMNRAVALGIGKDADAIIIVKEKLSDREIDPALFKAQKPDVFDKALAVERIAAQEKIQAQIDALSKFDVGTPVIRIKTVETMMSEDEIAAVCKPRTVTREYKVIKAGTALPKGKGIKLLTE